MSETTELLDHIHERFHRGRPYARRNTQGLDSMRPHEVALQLAFHLSCHVEGFGRLKFPRLFLGVAAIRGPVNIDNPAATRSMMIERTFPDRRRLRNLARETAAALSSLVGAHPGTQFFLGLAVKGAWAIGETALVRGSRGWNWYHDGIGQHFANPIDALVTLAQWEANQQENVDKVLCGAFLADLQDECSPHPLQLYTRNENCLAVLDDADSAGTRGFVDVLAAQRKERQARQQWDPLLIVAAAPTRPPTTGHQHPGHWVVHEAANANYRDWSEGRATNARPAALYPLEVKGLTFAEARAQLTGDDSSPYGPAVDVAGVLGDADKALRFAHRLTGGHLGGMRLVLGTLSLDRRRVGAENVDVRSVFSRPVAEDGISLAEEARGLLVGGWPKEMHRALVRSTAARDFGDQSLAAVLRREPNEVADMMRQFRFRDLWVRHPHGGDGAHPPRLQPFPRRGVVHLLAEPPGHPGATWDDVHRQLRTHAEARGDTTSAMYHRLALGEVPEVAEYLSTLFASEDTVTWYGIMTAVTQAPLAHPAREVDSEQHWLQLVGTVDDGPVEPAELVRLVVALQLHTDPLGDPGHQLCIFIASELERLARESRNLFFLLGKAEEFRNCRDRISDTATDAIS